MVSRFKLRLAARALRNGGVIAYPTESVYGFGCDPLDADAVDRITELKGRPPEAGYILIASDYTQLAPYIGDLEPPVLEKIHQTWPGPVTWVVPASSLAPPWITGGRDTVAVRVTAHPVASALCAESGYALVSTSANEHGEKPATRHIEALRRFGLEVDFIVPGSVGDLARPTEIRDARTNDVLRTG